MGNWLAYAFLNRWDSYYNDGWCQKLSTQLHEVGHNLGLEHSGDESNIEYGDETGMMGYSYFEDDTPEMCFNPAKNWQLQWYPDKQLELNPLTDLRSTPTSYVLNGIVDYENAADNHFVVLRLQDFYMGFNRKSDFNIGTREAPDMVTIQKKTGQPLERGKSKKVAQLVENQSYIMELEYANSDETLQVLIKYARNENGKDAVIELSKFDDSVELVCDADLVVELVTDKWPLETSWSIMDTFGDIVFTKADYTELYNTVQSPIPGLCRGTTYTFEIVDSYGGE